MCDSPGGRQLSAQLPKQESGTAGILMPSRFLEDSVSSDGRLTPEECVRVSKMSGFIPVVGNKRCIDIKNGVRKHLVEEITVQSDQQLRNQVDPLVIELLMEVFLVFRKVDFICLIIYI